MRGDTDRARQDCMILDRHAAAGDLDRGIQQAAAVIAQIKNEFSGSLFLQILDGLDQFFL